MASYGFGAGTNSGGSVNTKGAPPAGASTTLQLTLANAGPSWDAAANGTQGAWNFGNSSQPPLLKYADYDGAGTVFDCNQFPTGACGSLIPGQLSLSVEGPFLASGERLTPGLLVQLSASTGDARVLIPSSWRWRQLSGPAASLSGAASAQLNFEPPNADGVLVFELTAANGIGREYGRRILRFSSSTVADVDGNGLIDVDSLLKLHNMRHNLAGTSYKTSADAVGNTMGCPQGVCTGYELTRDLDFDADGDGSSWSEDGDGGYLLDAGDSRAPYFVVDEDGAGGWLPVGDDINLFTAVFDGNGHAIHNLGIRRAQDYIGLFGAITSPAAVRNLGLVANLADSLFASPAYVGGLAGAQLGGSITASYATGPAVSRGGVLSAPGGLVGAQFGGSITASYATGPVAAGSGSTNNAGGLVGWQTNGSITASYATGPVAGGSGNGNFGGLVGQKDGDLIASYATGNVHGGGGDRKEVGALVGAQSGGQISVSFGFGAVAGDSANALGGRPPAKVSAAQLTARNADARLTWNIAETRTLTLDAWDFGTNNQLPALKYGDYDGPDGTVFDCSQVPADACGTLLPGQAGLVITPSGFSKVAQGLPVRLSGSTAGRVPISSWYWRQLQGPPVTLSGATGPRASFTAPAGEASLVFEVTAEDAAGNEYNRRFTLFSAPAIDRDQNGLIEIDNLTMLHNMRYDLTGASYKTGEGLIGNSAGCPVTGCIGYELTTNLDFDADGDGSSWSEDGDGYRLDAGDSRAPYFVVSGGAGGWQPIGQIQRFLRGRLRRQRLQHPQPRHPPHSAPHRALRQHRRQRRSRPQSWPDRQSGGVHRHRRLHQQRRSDGHSGCGRFDHGQLRHGSRRRRQRKLRASGRFGGPYGRDINHGQLRQRRGAGRQRGLRPSRRSRRLAAARDDRGQLRHEQCRRRRRQQCPRRRSAGRSGRRFDQCQLCHWRCRRRQRRQ